MGSNDIFGVDGVSLLGGLPSGLESALVAPLEESISTIGLGKPPKSGASRDRLTIELDNTDLFDTDEEDNRSLDSFLGQSSFPQNRRSYSPSINSLPFGNNFAPSSLIDALTGLAFESPSVGIDESSQTTTLSFVQDKHLNLKVFENGIEVESVEGKNKQPVPNTLERLKITAIDSEDQDNSYLDQTHLDRGKGIGITDGDDRKSGLKKRIDGDEALEIKIKPTENYDSAVAAFISLEQIKFKSKDKKGQESLIEIVALAGDTVVKNGSYTVNKKKSVLTFNSDTPFDTLLLKAGNEGTQFTFRAIEFEAIKAAVEPPLIEATLANDTGTERTDRITSEAGITGTVTSQKEIASFTASFNPSTKGVDVLEFLQSDGSFALDQIALEDLNGVTLADGTQTLYLSASDQAGNTSNFELSFTLDTTAPSVELLTPITDGDHSTKARLIGSATDADGGVSRLEYSLDQETSVALNLDEQGQFDAPLSLSSLALGSHSLNLSTFDVAGNSAQTSVSFQVSDNFLIGGATTSGWGATTADTVLLGEGDSFNVQTALPIDLGQTEGARTLRFNLDAQFDTTDTTAVIEDQLAVYLVDPERPAQTLLDNGTPGTALFTLAGDDADFTPGQVRWDGSTVEIDLTSLEAETNGELRFQLLGHDKDTGSIVQIENITNTVDEEGTVNPVFPNRDQVTAPSEPLDLTGLNRSENVEVFLNNVRYSAASGKYTAELQVHNTGESLDRNVAVVFPNLPAGVNLVNASGKDESGAAYISLRNAIRPGGLESGAFSDSVEIIFDNPNLERFPLEPQVLVGGANVAPVFEAVGQLTVMPGDRLEVPLMATDANGDRVTFKLQSEGDLPTGKIAGDGKLVFTPAPDEQGTYEFTLIATDGVLETTQQVTLNVAPDPIKTTRISGVLLDTDGTPLVGVPLELARITTVTDAQGNFTIELPDELVPTEAINIEIPLGDPYFDPYYTGKQTIDLQRAAFDTTTGTSLDNPRRHPNLVSGFIDGSMVYGSEETRALSLRTLDGTGKLKTSAGDLLPFNTPEFFPDGSIENENAGRGNPSSLFVAGDARASENVALASIHTLLVREHNRLAELIAADNPELDDEGIYQQARRLVKAQIQHITYSEYLPVLLGEAGLGAYESYNPDVEPMVSALFSATAFRIGHSQSVAEILRLDESGNEIEGGHLNLRSAFFNTQPLVEDGIEPILRGLVTQLTQDVDTKAIDEVRNFLFGPPGSGGLDLISLGIQRGRDLGLPSYTQARLDFGLDPVTSFDQITSDVEVQLALQEVYGTVDKIDTFVGGLAEDHAPGAMVGDLFGAIIRDQFQRLRDGDRFWYENAQFSEAELQFIRSTSLTGLIERNTDITNLPDNVFTTGEAPLTSTEAGTATTTPTTEFASYDGSDNNLEDTERGASGENQHLNYTLDYGDGISSPAGEDRPGAREISNGLFDQQEDLPNQVGATTMSMFWGQFLAHDISRSGTGISNTLKIHGEELSGEAYPFIAEKLPLLLGHQVYEGVNNVISRPIYLPQIDTENAVTIDPTVDTLVTTDKLPGASVLVEAGTLQDQRGNDFTGQLSITEVPTELTPAALPDGLVPDMVVTIQPGEMVFNNPAPLSLPNGAGYEPGTEMDLWSINPVTGDFDKVGTGRVSEDGSVIETTEGGIRNSSWHFFTPPPAEPKELDKDPRNQEDGCNACTLDGSFNSRVEFHSGAVIETHDLVTYQSNGVAQGITLTYDSLRADPRPIIHFGYNNVQSDANTRLVAELSFNQDGYSYQVPGFAGGEYGLDGGEHFWSIPSGGGEIDAALQADIKDLPSGQYQYELTTGIRRFTGTLFAGSSTTNTDKILHVNSIDSAFGSGWGIAGWQEIVENSNGSILLIDGDGSELLFEAPETVGGTYLAPPGDFSTLERRPDGTFRRTFKNQTVYTFNEQNQLASMRDRHGNETRYVYMFIMPKIT